MNRSILIVMCDFLVSAMLSMMASMAPGTDARFGYGASLDRNSAALIMEELKVRGAELEELQAQLRKSQANEFSEEREAQIKRLEQQLAENIAKSELLEAQLALRPENSGVLSSEELQKRLAEEVKKRTLAATREQGAQMELERLRNTMRLVAGSLDKVNTNYTASREELEAARRALEERDKQLSNRKEDLSASQAELAAVRNSLQTELTRLEEARRKTAALSGEVAYTRGQLSTVERDLASARDQADRYRRQMEQKQLEERDAKRQLDDMKSQYQLAVTQLTQTRKDLVETKRTADTAVRERNEQAQTMQAKLVAAETATAKLSLLERELAVAEEKLRSDVLERYGSSAVRLNLALLENRMVLDQEAGGVYYLPLVNIGGKTVMPGYHKQLFGDDKNPLIFDKISKLEYRVNLSEAPPEEAGTLLRGPLFLFPEEHRLAAVEISVKGRKPLEAVTIEALKKRGLGDLHLFKSSTFGKESTNLAGRCSLDLAANDNYLYIRNPGRGTGGAELRAEPGDFIMTKQGEFVGIVIGLQNFDLGRRQEAKCYVLPENFTWENAPTVRIGKTEGRFYDDFSRDVRKIRESIGRTE